ncbi:hypothetical protein JIN82_02020 [Persicirhabdus sediminis]|uniref:Uncharacterized protein n=2 Tax=Persicirhabdus sediminis TaxID=454144 RepID=A0A8J7SHN3_9BACT|nr:hypothetical protein [Persicirhabdus sediminis]
MWGSMAMADDGAVIKHQFIATDESRAQLIHVNEFNPNENWAVELPGNREVHLLSEGRVLVNTLTGYREYDVQTGKMLKDVSRWKGVQSAVRTENGHTFVANSNEIIELDAEDNEVKSYDLKMGKFFRQLRFSEEGDFLFTSAKTKVKQVKKDGTVVRELDLAKAVSKAAKPYGIEPDSKGHFWVSTGYGGQLIELDSDWKVVGLLPEKLEQDGFKMHFISQIQHMDNGNIMLAHWTGHKPMDSKKAPQLLEFNRQGELVWKWHDAEMAGTLHGIIILQ